MRALDEAYVGARDHIRSVGADISVRHVGDAQNRSNAAGGSGDKGGGRGGLEEKLRAMEEETRRRREEAERMEEEHRRGMKEMADGFEIVAGEGDEDSR